MCVVGIFFGSDTGNTEKVAEMIRRKIGTESSDLFDVSGIGREHVETYSRLMFGISTWYCGEPQSDWENFIPTLRGIDFSDKKVALFGCGDQEDYPEYFCDAIGILRDVVSHRGGSIVGSWSTRGYKFKASRALENDQSFCGLAIDEDRQPELTEERVARWAIKIVQEMNSN